MRGLLTLSLHPQSPTRIPFPLSSLQPRFRSVHSAAVLNAESADDPSSVPTKPRLLQRRKKHSGKTIPSLAVDVHVRMPGVENAILERWKSALTCSPWRVCQDLPARGPITAEVLDIMPYSLGFVVRVIRNNKVRQAFPGARKRGQRGGSTLAWLAAREARASLSSIPHSPHFLT